MTQTNDILQSAIAEKNKSLKAGFLREWGADQFKAMQRAICSHFSGKYFSGRYHDYQPQYRTFNRLSEIFGFAYTSSSEFAGYWVCNDDITTSNHPGFNYMGFAMTEGNKPFAILWDKDENEILLPL